MLTKEKRCWGQQCPKTLHKCKQKSTHFKWPRLTSSSFPNLLPHRSSRRPRDISPGCSRQQEDAKGALGTKRKQSSDLVVEVKECEPDMANAGMAGVRHGECREPTLVCIIAFFKALPLELLLQNEIIPMPVWGVHGHGWRKCNSCYPVSVRGKATSRCARVLKSIWFNKYLQSICMQAVGQVRK